MITRKRFAAWALVVLAALFLAIGRYRVRSARPVPAVAPVAPPPAAALHIPTKKKARKRIVAKMKDAIAPPIAPKKIRGERLREKGEAFGGGKEQRRVAADEKAARTTDQ